jgi:hypothetical protein
MSLELVASHFLFQKPKLMAFAFFSMLGTRDSNGKLPGLM